MAERPGASIAVLTRDEQNEFYVAAIQRDTKPDIAYPGWWELPGGTLEEDETPEIGAARECDEEIHVTVDPEEIHGNDEHLIEDPVNTTLVVAVVSLTKFATMRLGDEGQACKLIRLEEFLGNTRVIPEHRMRLNRYLMTMGYTALMNYKPILVSTAKEE